MLKSVNQRIKLAKSMIFVVLAAALITSCRRTGSDEVHASGVIAIPSERERVSGDGTPSAAPTPRSVSANPVTATNVLAWAGSSALGYIRAELWVAESESSGSFHELRVIHPNGNLHSHRGRMIPIPRDFAPAGGPWTAFVAETTQRYPNPYPAFLASVNAAGVMRLYEFAGPDGIAACDLQPIR